MTQSLIDDAGCAPEAALRRLEYRVQHLREQVQILQVLVEEEGNAYALPPRRRLSHPVKLYVIAGGLAALLFGASPVLPVGNPIREAVDYTVSGLLDQMPREIPDPPDLNLPGSKSTVVLGNPDGEHRPLYPVAAVKGTLDLPKGSDDSPSADLPIRSMRPSSDQDHQVVVGTEPAAPDSGPTPTISTSSPAARKTHQDRPPEPTPSVAPAPTATVSVPMQGASLAPLGKAKPPASSSAKPKPTKTPPPTPREEATTNPSPDTNKGKGKPPKAKGKPQASPQPTESPAG